jgi:hypothetical protein
MGEAKRRAATAKALLPYALSGQLQPASGSKLDGKTPDVVAHFAAGEPNLTAIMDELLSGRIVRVTGVRQSTVTSVEDWLASKAGLGAELLAELRRAHDDPDRGSQIYPMMFGDELAIEIDRSYFVVNPQRQLRLRPLVGEERRVGELNHGWTDRVVSIMVDRTNGIRSRFFFGCPEASEDAKLDLDDLQIARLALKYARAKSIPALDAEDRRASKIARHAQASR